MTRKKFYLFSYGVMALLLVASLVAGQLFPFVPSYAYALIGLAVGIVLFLILKTSIKKSNLILSDERTQGNYDFAAAFTYRVMLFGSILFISIIGSIPRIPIEWIIASRTVIVFMLVQLVVFYVVYAIRCRKS
ncbi:MAG: hypothetical protein WCT14_00070 [Treponemataceae bacterium]